MLALFPLQSMCSGFVPQSHTEWSIVVGSVGTAGLSLAALVATTVAAQPKKETAPASYPDTPIRFHCALHAGGHGGHPRARGGAKAKRALEPAGRHRQSCGLCGHHWLGDCSQGPSG